MPLIMSLWLLLWYILLHACDYIFDYKLEREKPNMMLEPAATTDIWICCVFFPSEILTFHWIPALNSSNNTLRLSNRSIFIECVWKKKKNDQQGNCSKNLNLLQLPTWIISYKGYMLWDFFFLLNFSKQLIIYLSHII